MTNKFNNIYLLIFKYLTNNLNLKFTNKNKSNIYIYINAKKFYLIATHLYFSQFFYTTQLVDLFAYNISSKQLLINQKISNINTNNNLIIANFYNFFNSFNIYICIFNNTTIKSIENLFLNAMWLEREYSEMNNILIINKTDTRNLLLQYNDSTNPLTKSFSSIGLFEIYYNLINDSLIKIKIFSQ